jgi:Fis family transcriptional regulator|tara:strand:+ start:1023 stop:1160 length:138 start_codon:yes stop_codon:yes gene_type:complete
MIIRRVEEPLIETILEQTGGNLSKAAKILGLSRITLRKKINKKNT